MDFNMRPEFYRDRLKEIKIPETVSNLTFAFKCIRHSFVPLYLDNSFSFGILFSHGSIFLFLPFTWLVPILLVITDVLEESKYREKPPYYTVMVVIPALLIPNAYLEWR